MKNLLLIFLFLFVNNLNAEIIVKKLVKFKSCEEILLTGNSNGNGMYNLNKANGLENVYCDMTTNGGGWQRMTGQDLIDNENLGQVIARSDGTVLDSEQIGRFRRIYNEGHEALMHQTIYQDTILPHASGSNIIRDLSYDLPTLPFDMKALIKVDYFWSWEGDSDTGRFYTALLDSTGANFNAIDTGNVNWPSSGTSRSWVQDVPTNAEKVRFYGQCRRKSGTMCSAEIRYGSFILNGDLPLREDYILVK